MQNKNASYWLIPGIIIIAGLLYWLSVQEKPLPDRNFSTSQVLLSPLPGWGIYSGPENMQPRYYNFDDAVSFSEIRFMKPPVGVGKWSRADVDNGLWEQVADMTQWVVRFSTIGDARQAYSDRYMVINGRNTPVYVPLESFKYKSLIADQFRILCDSSLPQKGGIDCALDAQYDEFYVTIHYSGGYLNNKDHFIGELKTIAIAVDAQMEKYLSPHK